MSKKACTVKDLYIAKKLRERRIQLGLTQKKLATSLGIALQQIHKYEKGVDRVPASRLYEVSKLLSVPLMFFYEEIEEDASSEIMKELVGTCVNLQGKKVRLKFLQLKAILTDIQTQEDYNIDVS